MSNIILLTNHFKMLFFVIYLKAAYEEHQSSEQLAISEQSMLNVLMDNGTFKRKVSVQIISMCTLSFYNYGYKNQKIWLAHVEVWGLELPLYKLRIIYFGMVQI